MNIKGALHIHSNISQDADLTRGALKSMFKKRGYSFIALTEHAESLNDESYVRCIKECADLSDGSFLMIPGIEIKWRNGIHFLAYGAKRYIRNEDELPAAETARKIKEQTECELLVWGHFTRSARLDADLLETARAVDGIEIANTLHHGKGLPHFRGMLLLNALWQKGRGPIGISGLDMHSGMTFDRGHGLFLDANEISPKEIFRLLKAGEFMSGRGAFAFRGVTFGLPLLAASFAAAAGRHLAADIRKAAVRSDEMYCGGSLKRRWKRARRVKEI